MSPTADIKVRIASSEQNWTPVETVVGTLYEVDGELYPSNTSVPAYLTDAESWTTITCGYDNCQVGYGIHHTGLWHQSRQVLEYRVYSTSNNENLSRHPQLVFDQSDLFPGWRAIGQYKRMDSDHSVSGLPKCGIRAVGSAQHSAWYGLKVTINGVVASVSDVGTFGRVTAASTVSAKESSDCPTPAQTSCDDPMTDEIETECSGGSGGSLVSGGRGSTEAPGIEHGGTSESVWRCDVIYWYQSDDGGVTWYYTGYEIVGNCALEPR